MREHVRTALEYETQPGKGHLIQNCAMGLATEIWTKARLCLAEIILSQTPLSKLMTSFSNHQRG